MRGHSINVVVLVVFGLCAVAVGPAAGQAAAQKTSKSLYTDYPPHLCVGGGFVAMAGVGMRDQLVVITIDSDGIEPPQTIQTGGDEVDGLQCSEQYIQVLVTEYKSGESKSDRLFTPLYSVDRYHGPIAIQEKSREELNLPKSGPTPPAVSCKFDSARWGSHAGERMRGDWYVSMQEGYYGRPYNTYEVHFVSTEVRHREGGLTSKLDVTLLEETPDKKVTKSVPLVHIDKVRVGRLALKWVPRVARFLMISPHAPMAATGVIIP